MVQGLELFEEFDPELFKQYRSARDKAIDSNKNFTIYFIFKKLAREIKTIIGNAQMHPLNAEKAAGWRHANNNA